MTAEAIACGRPCSKAGASTLTVHVETCPHLHRTLQYIKSLGCKAGVVLNPGTAVGAIEPTVTLIVSAYNEQDSIGEKLRNSLELDYPADRLEIIRLSGYSDDEKLHIARTYILPRQLRVRRHRRVAAQGGSTNAPGGFSGNADAPVPPATCLRASKPVRRKFQE